MPTSTFLNSQSPTGQAYTPYIGNNGGQSTVESLTLAGGMTAGWGHNDGNTQNPPLLGAGSNQGVNPYGGMPNFPVSRVGTLRNRPGMVPGGKDCILNFLYNPREIDVHFDVDANAMPSNYLFGIDPAHFTTTAATTGSQTVSWTLLFDRTYDMMYDPDPNGNRGVLKDVGALYGLMGTFLSEGAVPMATLCEVVFGQTDNGDIWGFTGFIAGVTITYPLFRHNMIPSRAEVQLSMTTVYVGAMAPSGGGNPAAGAGPPPPVVGLFQGPNPGPTDPAASLILPGFVH